MTLQQMQERLDRTLATLRARLDPDRRKSELAEVLKPFQKGGPYAYVPAREGRIPAEQRYLKRWNDLAGRDLYALGRANRDIEPALVQIKAQSMRPQSNEDALLVRTKQRGTSLETHLLVQLLDEQRRQRLSVELREATPAAVGRRYADALQDPTEQANCTLIAVVEELHGDGWTGREISEQELPAVQQLRRAIARAREERVPEDVRELEALLQEAKIEEGRAERLHRIHAINPDHIPPLREDDE